MVAAAYTHSEDGDQLCLAESAGVPRSLYGLRDSYPLTGGTPAADVHRSGQPLWLTPEDLGRCADARRLPNGDFSLAVLPLGDGGCLAAVSERAGGFDADDRECLRLLAGSVACPAPAAPALTGSTDSGEPADSSFSLAMDSGRITVDDEVLELFGIGPDEFDGKVETLLALTVPEDLPSLMSVVEPGHMSIGDRELEFRILQPSGGPRWLRLRGRLLPAEQGRPALLVGSVADASRMRAGVSDVTRVQRLAAALATAGTVREVGRAVVTALRKPLQADRIALAELEGDRLVVTVLDPPEPDSWPELWRSEWRSEWPDAPVRAMPTLASALSEGAPRSGPPGPRWSRRSRTSAPAVSPCCPWPRAAGWPASV